MSIEAVVVNASPLITLFRSGQAQYLPRLFARIVVPDAVWSEVVTDHLDDPAARALPTVTWIERVNCPMSLRVNEWGLGAGESSVLTYALTQPPIRAVVDDAAARRCATTLGIPLLGTGGVLLLAKRRGLLPSMADALAKLREAGLWMSNDLARMLLTHAGE